MFNDFEIKAFWNSLRDYNVVNIVFEPHNIKSRQGAYIYFRYDGIILKHYTLNPFDYENDIVWEMDHLINTYNKLISGNFEVSFHPVESLALCRFVKSQIHAEKIFVYFGWSFEKEEDFMNLFKRLHICEDNYKSILLRMIAHYRNLFPDFFAY